MLLFKTGQSAEFAYPNSIRFHKQNFIEDLVFTVGKKISNTQVSRVVDGVSLKLVESLYSRLSSTKAHEQSKATRHSLKPNRHFKHKFTYGQA